ncbi:MAG: hypothetical protein WA323_14670, partial [Candidatus Nitrosopolaris sp.]
RWFLLSRYTITLSISKDGNMHIIMLRRFSSRISVKIGILVGIQIVFVVSNIAIFAYFESQGALLGNSINIAGKNRFLTYDVLVQILKYISGFSNVSAVNIAMKNFESNLTVLRGSGAASPAMELEPLTSQNRFQLAKIQRIYHR